MRCASTGLLAVGLVTGCLESPPGSSADPDLLAGFRFEEQTGFLTDSSGHGHDATCADVTCPQPTIARDDVSGAAMFDGGDDQIVVDPVGAGPFTVMLWLRMDQAPVGAACPVSKVFGAAGGNSWQLCMSVPSPGQVSLALWTTDDPALVGLDLPMELGSWHHAALRWDGTDKTLWWDGLERACGTGITRFDTGNVLVGADVDGGDPLAYFAGAIDDVEIHDSALDPGEIAVAAGL